MCWSKPINIIQLRLKFIVFVDLLYLPDVYGFMYMTSFVFAIEKYRLWCIHASPNVGLYPLHFPS